MRRLHHLLLSPASRLARLMLAEKRVAYDPVHSDDPLAHLPALAEDSGMRHVGLWAILDHLEGEHPAPPLVPDDDAARSEALRLLDWAMGPLHDSVTRRIVYEKAAQRFTGVTARRAPDVDAVRAGRQALRQALAMLGGASETHGYLAGRACSIADLAVAAHLSAIDYFGEVPWAEHPAAAEWYVRMKSRPSFRSLLADRVPGQPPAAHYAELDF